MSPVGVTDDEEYLLSLSPWNPVNMTDCVTGPYEKTTHRRVDRVQKVRKLVDPSRVTSNMNSEINFNVNRCSMFFV